MGGRGASSSLSGGIKKKFRGQLDNGFDYNGRVHEKDLDELNKKALAQIIKDTGYSENKAKELQSDMQDYLGGDYKGFEQGKYPAKVKTIDEGLSKMPSYDGEIYRGMHLDNDTMKSFENLKQGDPIKMKSISSWSSNEDVATSYGFVNDYQTNSVIFVCDNNKSGCGVQHISKWGKGESEVLLPSTAKWKVTQNKTQTKYDYLKSEYKKSLEQAKIPPQKIMYQNLLNDLEANKDKYMKSKISVIKVKEY